MDALFGFVEFNDAKTAEQNKHNNVSIFAPSESKDGKGNTYVDAIRHVALTDYPVIPGLGKFDLVLSFVPGNKNMDKIAELLGIDPKAPDLEAALETAITALLAKVKEGSKEPTPEPDKKPVEAALPAGVAASMSNMVVNARNATIDSLVAGAYLTPASAKIYKTQFCDNKSLELSLTTTGDVGDNVFDNTIAAIKANGKVLALGEKTGAQLPPGLQLSGDEIFDSEKNPLLASADRMAKAATR